MLQIPEYLLKNYHYYIIDLLFLFWNLLVLFKFIEWRTESTLLSSLLKSSVRFLFNIFKICLTALRFIDTLFGKRTHWLVFQKKKKNFKEGLSWHLTYKNFQDLISGTISKKRLSSCAADLIGPAVGEHGARAFILPWSVNGPVSVDDGSSGAASESLDGTTEELRLALFELIQSKQIIKKKKHIL